MKSQITAAFVSKATAPLYRTTRLNHPNHLTNEHPKWLLGYILNSTNIREDNYSLLQIFPQMCLNLKKIHVWLLDYIPIHLLEVVWNRDSSFTWICRESHQNFKMFLGNSVSRNNMFRWLSKKSPSGLNEHSR